MTDYDDLESGDRVKLSGEATRHGQPTIVTIENIDRHGAAIEQDGVVLDVPRAELEGRVLRVL